MRTGFSQIGNNWAAVAFNQIAPKDDAGRPQPNKVFSESDKKLIVNGILNACDANDGLKDGMVFNTRRSRDNIRQRLSHSMRQLPRGAWTWKVDDVFRDPSRPRPRDTEGLWERSSSPPLMAKQFVQKQ